MGVSKDDLNLARAFAEKAKQDISSARILLKNENFANSIYHSQQASEKIIKVLLVLQDIYVNGHILSPILVNIKKKINIENIDEVIKNLKETEEYWLKSKHPEISQIEVSNPLNVYKKDDAENAIKKAEFILSSIKKFLENKYYAAVADWKI